VNRNCSNSVVYCYGFLYLAGSRITFSLAAVHFRTWRTTCHVLQLGPYIGHHSCGSSFSRASTVIRPRTKRLAPDVWLVREQAVSHFEAAPFERIRPSPFAR